MLMSPYKGKENYVFISYSHRDMKDVYELVENLQNNGFNVWYDEGIDPGTEWDENIARHINECSYFIAFVTNAYIQSQNCKDELNYARDLDKDRLLIYGEDVELPAGMKMRLGRLQAIFKNKYKDEHAFYNKVFEAQGLEICRAGNEVAKNSFNKQIEQIPIKNNNNKNKHLIIASIVAVIAIAIIIVTVTNKPDESNQESDPNGSVSESMSEGTATNPSGDSVVVKSIEVMRQDGNYINIHYVVANNTDQTLKEVHLEGEAYDKDGNILQKICPGGQNTINPGRELSINFVWDVTNENSEYYGADVYEMKIYGYSYENDSGYYKYSLESEIGPIPIREPKMYTFTQ